MKMEVNKSFTVNANIEKTWALLSNPMRVVTCVPGAKITEKIDEDNYKGMIEVKIGPMLSQYEGDAVLEEKDDENHVLSLMGKGVDVKGKGSASMNMKGNLKEISSSETEVESSMTLDISGKVAQLGSRMIKAVNNQMFEQFKSNFIEKVESNSDGDQSTEEDEAAEAAESKPINAIWIGLVVFWGAITSPFRKLYRWIRGSGKKEKDIDKDKVEQEQTAETGT